MKHWQDLAQMLTDWSRKLNDLPDCDYFSYITKKGRLIAICHSDYYFPGYSGKYAAISLPFCGDGKNLRKLVMDQVDNNQ